MFAQMLQLQKLTQLQAQGRYDEMLAVFDEMLASNPNQGLAWHGRGTLLLQRGRIHEAGQAFTEAVRVGGPGTDQSVTSLASCWRQCFQPENALVVLEMALQQPGISQENRQHWHFGRFQAYLQFNQPERALEALQDFREAQGPTTWMVQLFEAEALARLGRLSEARALLGELPEEARALGQALEEVLERPVVTGHLGLVEWAHRRVAGAPLELFEVLNHPTTVHAQRHLGTLIDVGPAGPGRHMLVLQANPEQPWVRLLSQGRSKGSELMLSLPKEGWSPWAECLQEWLTRELTAGQILSHPALPAPYRAILVAPSPSVSEEFHRNGPVRFLAGLPLLEQDQSWLRGKDWKDLLNHWKAIDRNDFANPGG